MTNKLSIFLHSLKSYQRIDASYVRRIITTAESITRRICNTTDVQNSTWKCKKVVSSYGGTHNQLF